MYLWNFRTFFAIQDFELHFDDHSESHLPQNLRSSVTPQFVSMHLPLFLFLCWGPKSRPGGRGTPLQTPKIDQFWGLFFRVLTLPPDSWFGNHIQQIHSPGGGVVLTIKYPLSVFNKNSIHDVMIIERKISFHKKNSELTEKSKMIRHRFVTDFTQKN